MNRLKTDIVNAVYERKQKTYLPRVYERSTQHWGYRAAQTQPSLIPDKRWIRKEEDEEQEKKREYLTFIYHDTVRA